MREFKATTALTKFDLRNQIYDLPEVDLFLKVNSLKTDAFSRWKAIKFAWMMLQKPLPSRRVELDHFPSNRLCRYARRVSKEVRMKLFGMAAVLVIVFSAGTFAQSKSHSSREENINLPVEDLQIEARNIHLMLSKLAYEYNVPISLEVAFDDDLLNSKRLKVNVKKGTLADALDSIVTQQPTYSWKSSESTIRVFPKDEFRDPFLHTLLETKITHFVIPLRTARLTFKQKLTSQPELKDLLASNGVSLSTDGILNYEIRSFGPDFTLDLQNAPVQEILNYVIKNSQTRYWFIRRSGDLLFLNF